MKTVELNVPRVKDGAGRIIGYAGSQDWFLDRWKQRSGCGPTTGAGAAAVLAAESFKAKEPSRPKVNCAALFPPAAKAGIEFSREIPKGSSLCEDTPAAGVVVNADDYIALMEEMFSRMTPRMMGYPYAGKWARAFRDYAAERGVSLTAEVFEHWTKWSDAFSLVKEHIDSDIPVPMLVLYHRSKEMQEIIWHWVLITGYTESDADESDARQSVSAENAKASQIIISDCADRDIYRADIAFEAQKRNLVKLIDIRL